SHVDVIPNGSAILADLPIALQANGDPILLYLDNVLGTRPGWLIARFCSDATCSVAATEQVLAVPPSLSPVAELARRLDSQGVPVATYLTSEGASNLYDSDIGVCSGSPLCSTVTNTTISQPVPGTTPTRTALALRSDRRPLGLDNQGNAPALLDCATSA